MSRPAPARALAAALVLLLAALPPLAHAGLFDALDALKKKLDNSSAQTDATQDAAYEAEMARRFPPYRFDTPAKEQAPNYVEVVRGSNFKDIRKVGIVNFSVEFALFKEVQASGGSTHQGSTARDASKAMKIPAPDIARLQAVVDRLYAQTAEDFRAMGIEVVPLEVLKATKNWAELAPAQHASPWLTDTKDTQSVFIAPSGMPLYMDNPERADFLQGLGFTFGTNTRMKEVMMTYDLKQEVHLMSVNMVVDFAAMKTSGRSFISYAAVGGANMHHLHANNTYYRFISTTQPELLVAKLKQPLVSDVKLIAETSRSASSTSTQGVGGGLAVETTATTTATRGTDAFDAETWHRRSADMLDAARQMFAAELARAR
ncbi:MAG: hypothetical protein H6933_08850 [Burkholderiaceae bacterium]|nr:hypothetical protein [Burkholderiaceae bacterium]